MSVPAVAWVMERGANETAFFVWGNIVASGFSVSGQSVLTSWLVREWPDVETCRRMVTNSVDRMELEGYLLATGPLVIDVTKAEAQEVILSQKSEVRLTWRLNALALGGGR